MTGTRAARLWLGFLALLLLGFAALALFVVLDSRGPLLQATGDAALAEETEVAERRQTEAGRAHLQIRLEPGASRLAVMGPDRYVYFAGRSSGELLALPRPGSYTVTATRDGYRAASEQVQVGPTETVMVSLTLRPLLDEPERQSGR